MVGTKAPNFIHCSVVVVVVSPGTPNPRGRHHRHASKQQKTPTTTTLCSTKAWAKRNEKNANEKAMMFHVQNSSW